MSAANTLTKSIITFLKLNGHHANRINTMGREIVKHRTGTNYLTGGTSGYVTRKWIPGTTQKGTADIDATIRGRSVKIEVKIGRDRQSEAQKRYQDQIERAGGIYIIAKTFDEFNTWYNQFIQTL